MSLPNKIRFEVFKRDSFRCGYCGHTPPQVVLQVDHIEPKSLGGSDDLANLLTACFECNSGKKAVPLTQLPKSIAANLSESQEKENQIRAYNEFLRSIQARIDIEIELINDIYKDTFKKWELSDSFKKMTVKRFLKKLPFEEVKEAMELACFRHPKNGDACTLYFCGICWKKIKGEMP